MRINKKLFFKIHSWIGIKLSILFFIVCFSGTLATISHELDWLFTPEFRATPTATLASKDSIVKNIQAAYPEGQLTTIIATPEPYLCNLAYLEQDEKTHYVFVNQYTGEVQGKTNLTIQRYLRDLHYFLFIPFQIGHFTVLLFGFLLFISTVTALVFYKNWWKKLFQLKSSKNPLVLFRSLHRLIGVWSVPFTILFSITGIWYFLERSNIASIKETANMKMPKIEAVALDSVAFAQLQYTIDYDSVVAVAENAIPGLTVGRISIPQQKDEPIYITGKSDVPLVRKRANRVFIHPLTYEVVGVQNANDINTTTWLNDIADPLHFGYFGGLTTKILWFFGGLGITFLVGSGIWISLKRKVKNIKKAKAQRLGGWKYPNLIIVFLMFVSMYISLFNHYAAPLFQVSVITLCWAITIYLGWYVYIKKIKRE